MKKIEMKKETLLSDLAEFYNDQKWHFITVNCVDSGEGFEVQYLFSKYGEVDEVRCFFVNIDYEVEIPSVSSLIESAWLGEGEMVDMFGVKINGVNKGTFLDEDSMQTPLRRNK